MIPTSGRPGVAHTAAARCRGLDPADRTHLGDARRPAVPVSRRHCRGRLADKKASWPEGFDSRAAGVIVGARTRQRLHHSGVTQPADGRSQSSRPSRYEFRNGAGGSSICETAWYASRDLRARSRGPTTGVRSVGLPPGDASIRVSAWSTRGGEAVASLFGPRWGIPLMPVAGLGASRAAGLKLAVWRQSTVAVPGHSPSSHDPTPLRAAAGILVQ
jgi:hypothetical protein